MITVYLPPGKHQTEERLEMTVDEYKVWLTKRGEVLRILPLRWGDPRDADDGIVRGMAAWATKIFHHFEPCVEVYKGHAKDHFHFIGASKEERAILETWITSLYVAKNGYIRISGRLKRKVAA